MSALGSSGSYLPPSLLQSPKQDREIHVFNDADSVSLLSFDATYASNSTGGTSPRTLNRSIRPEHADARFHAYNNHSRRSRRHSVDSAYGVAPAPFSNQVEPVDTTPARPVRHKETIDTLPLRPIRQESRFHVSNNQSSHHHHADEASVSSEGSKTIEYGDDVPSSDEASVSIAPASIYTDPSQSFAHYAFMSNSSAEPSSAGTAPTASLTASGTIPSMSHHTSPFPLLPTAVAVPSVADMSTISDPSFASQQHAQTILAYLQALTTHLHQINVLPSLETHNGTFRR